MMRVFLVVLLVSVPILSIGWAQPDASAKPGISAVLRSVTYDGKRPVRLTYGGLEVTIDSVKTGSGDLAPRAIGRIANTPAFTMQFDATMDPSARLEVVKLAGDVAQVVFQHFTFGAHCCTETKIATSRTGATWTIVDADTLDGDGGYAFQDLAADGLAELVTTDQDFYYTYASYAESLAPVKIERFDGAKLVDVSADPRFRGAVQRSLDDLDRLARTDETEWHSNGFLAAWVATRARLGDGRAAWATMLTTYDRHPTNPPQVCAVEVTIGSCPDGKARDATLPVALRANLLAAGYIEDTAGYRIPPEDVHVPK